MPVWSSGGGVPTTGANLTPEGGVAIKAFNNTGGVLSKGTVVEPSGTHDRSVAAVPAGSSFPIGVIYEDIPDGEEGLVVVNGIADVLVDNAGATARNYVMLVSTTTAGSATAQAAVPSATEHWREVGHTIASRSGPGLVRSVLHQN